MPEKKYDNTIQLMRAIAVIMVVLQHSISRIAANDLEFKVIYFLNHIDVAVFFVIAGYLFELKKEKYYQKSIVDYIREKVLALLIPYLFWSLILAFGIKFAAIFFSGIFDSIGMYPWTLGEIAVNTLFFRDYYVQHLWFIYVLFFFFIFNRLFKDWLINKKIFVLILLLSIVLNRIGLNYILDKFVLHFAVFLIGRLIVKFSLVQYFHKRWMMIAVPCVVLFCFINELLVENSFTYTYLGNTIYALSGAYCVYLISRFIGSIYKESKLEVGLRKVGNYSFEIYLMHNPYISVLVPMILGKILSNDMIIVAITTILGVMIPYYIANILLLWPKITVVLFGRRGRKKNETCFFNYRTQ